MNAAARALADLGSAYWINDRRLSGAFATALTPEVADLITVALHCYAADRTTRRPVDWSRVISLRVPVSDPDRWRANVGQLIRYLEVLTSDRWALEFVGARPMLASERQPTLFPDRFAGSGAVALFSGGLDSLAGSAIWLENHSDPTVLVGIRSSRVVGRDQARQAADLRAQYGTRVKEIGIPLELRGVASVEPSQRTRGYLHLSLAAATCLAADIPRVIVFENGYGAYNPRLAENQFGAAATRSTHPFVLGLFTRWMASMGMPVSVLLPHRWQTKAEVLRALPDSVRHLVSRTASCDSYPLHRSNQSHCGRCGSCVLRRQSLVSAGIGSLDRTDYQWMPLDRGVEANDIVRLMARQAWLMGEISQFDAWEALVVEWPSLMLGADSLPWVDQIAIVRLLRAYAREWADLMEQRPWLRDSLGWPNSREAVPA